MLAETPNNKGELLVRSTKLLVLNQFTLMWAEYFKEQNELFDEEKFIKATGYVKGQR